MAIHMSKGEGEGSYKQNSAIQKYFLDKAFTPYLPEVLAKLRVPAETDTPVLIADLGCSSGTNSIVLVSDVVEEVKMLHKGNDSMVFQVFFSDLPSNDFNTLFQLLFSPNIKRSDFFKAAVPGTFYGSLFPRSKVHIFISTMALHYLSKVPASVMDKDSQAFNKTGVYVTTNQCSDETVKACRAQFAEDLDTFLSFREGELAEGGMILLMFCTSWDPSPDQVGRNGTFHLAMEHTNRILTELSHEGLVTQDQIDRFNFPLHFPHLADVKEVIYKHDSKLEVVTLKEVNVKPFLDVVGENHSNLVKAAMSMYKGVSADYLLSQFGERASDLFWERFEGRISGDDQALRGESPLIFVALRKKD